MGQTKSEILTEMPPISEQDMFVLFERRKEHFNYPIHIHNVYELNFIHGAEGATRIVGDSVETIGQYDMVLITGSKLEHAWVDGNMKANAEIREVTIQFSENLFYPNGMLARKQFSSIKKMFQNAQHGLSFSQETTIKAQELIQQLINGGTRFEAVLTFFSLLNLIAEDKNAKILSNEQFSSFDKVYDSRRVRVVSEYLKENYHKKIMLNEVAALVNMSAPAFSRFIKVRTGCSFVEYLNNIRISAVVRQLVDYPTMPISEIAYSCGFCNLSNFNRIFRSVKNCSPHEFREYYRKKKIII